MADVIGPIVLFTLEGVVGVAAKVLEDGVADVTATLEEGTYVALFTIEWVAGITAGVLEGIILKEGVVDITATFKDGMAGNMFILLDVTSCCRNGVKCWATPAAATYHRSAAAIFSFVPNTWKENNFITVNLERTKFGN